MTHTMAGAVVQMKTGKKEEGQSDVLLIGDSRDGESYSRSTAALGNTLKNATTKHMCLIIIKYQQPQHQRCFHTAGRRRRRSRSKGVERQQVGNNNRNNTTLIIQSIHLQSTD